MDQPKPRHEVQELKTLNGRRLPREHHNLFVEENLLWLQRDNERQPLLNLLPLLRGDELHVVEVGCILLLFQLLIVHNPKQDCWFLV